MSPAVRLEEGVWWLALRTPTLPPATTTNTLVVAGSSFVVIEPGTPHEDEQARLAALIDRLLARGSKFAAVLATHHHPDHVGGAEYLWRRYGAELWVHPLSEPRLRHLQMPVRGRLTADCEIDLGAGLRIASRFTPGHAPGHVVLSEECHGIVHAGDLVAGEGSILIDPDDDGDMAAYTRSLAAMIENTRTRPNQRWVPAHGPLQTRPDQLLEQYLAHRLEREAKVWAALGAESRPLFDIVALAYADTPRSLWPFAEKAARAHLEKLAAEGSAHRHVDVDVDVDVDVADGDATPQWSAGPRPAGPES